MKRRRDLGPLTPRMTRMFDDVPAAWAAMPRRISPTNVSLAGLQGRGLVETRLNPGGTGLQWRRKPESIPTAERDLPVYRTAPPA